MLLNVSFCYWDNESKLMATCVGIRRECEKSLRLEADVIMNYVETSM